MDPAHITLPATPASVSLGRAWARLLLDGSPGRAAVEQVVGELLGEALAQGAEGDVRVELQRTAGECVVVVTSREPGPTTPGSGVDLGEHPRLVIVDALADSLEQRVDVDGVVIMRARITWME
ncbi:hypothetical protein [Embleya sp. NPDC001921]